MTNFLTALCKKLHPEPKGWAFQYGNPGLKLLPTDTNTFTFPSAPDGSVNYLTKAHTQPLLHKIRLICRITADPNTVFDFHTNPNNTGTHPSSVRLFFQHKNDDLSGKGPAEFYRWWSTGHILLAPGDHELSVPIDHTQWTSIYGKTEPQAFLNCCNNVGRVGLTFGGGSYFGHGVRTTSGTATFQLLEFTAL